MKGLERNYSLQYINLIATARSLTFGEGHQLLQSHTQLCQHSSHKSKKKQSNREMKNGRNKSRQRRMDDRGEERREELK
jgi:hypothetical protein